MPTGLRGRGLVDRAREDALTFGLAAHRANVPMTGPVGVW